MTETELLQQLSSATANEVPGLLERVLDTLCAQRPYYTWAGFYFLHGNTLELGPFRGLPTEHAAIPLGSGICGAAAAQNETIVVPDVRADSRYLACFVSTRSEIVVPIRDGAEVLGEIDIDSDRPNAFTDEDRRLLESIAERLGPLIAKNRPRRAPHAQGG